MSPKKAKKHGRFAVNIKGKRYGRLIVVCRVENAQTGHSQWNCICDCGTHITVTYSNLHNGSTLSCKCLRSENTTTHGKSKSNSYRSWRSMKGRVLNPHHKHFNYYGGRGINICRQWMTFEGFFKSMGDREDGMTLERIDNAKGYYPENCRWASRRDQMRNTKRSRFLTINNETLCLTEWSLRSGIGLTTITKRLQKGWDSQSAVFTASIRASKTPRTPAIQAVRSK